jgi:hypothetical protein
MQAGESGLLFTIDSLAGQPGQITTASLATATCTLTVAGQMRGPNGEFPRVVVPTSRLTPTGDGRTFLWHQLATDTPYPGTYELALVATFPDGVTVRMSTPGFLTVDPSP